MALSKCISGKSTIRRLLSSYAQPLADDIVYLVRENAKEYTVAKVDCNGRLVPEEAVLSHERVPLIAVFRLHQVQQPRLERTGRPETCRHLMRALFEIGLKYDVEARKRAFSQVAAIARRTLGYCLHFDQSVQTAEMIREEIQRVAI